jgi:hypothetical protein
MGIGDAGRSIARVVVWLGMGRDALWLIPSTWRMKGGVAVDKDAGDGG